MARRYPSYIRRSRLPLGVQSFSRAAGGPLAPGVVQPVSRDAGAFRGTLANYRPWRPAPLSSWKERSTASLRSEDLVANDWAAKSVVETITLNAVGANGITPQASIPAGMLGIDEETARTIGNDMEAAFRMWSEHAGLGGQHFADLQFMGLRSALVHGEMLQVPVMVPEASDSGFMQLRLQPVHPERICTPADKLGVVTMRDGIELDRLGRPFAVWVACPDSASWAGINSWQALGSGNFRRVPYRVGHRVGIFHCFRATAEEQFRGEPVITPALKLFRHLADSLEYELIGQIVAASFPLFIKVQSGTAGMQEFLETMQNPLFDQGQEQERVYHQSYAPGQVLYGNEGDEAKPLTSDRPGANWAGFVNFIVRAMGASAGLPYEALLKDFSQTNYSSARAALLEAWRVYLLWRQWQARAYCQPVYRMVVEEAYLRGIIKLPAGAPGFYNALPLWTAARWVGPGRGYIDPVKEVDANITMIENGLATYGEVLAERGLAVEEVWAARGNEERLMQRLAPSLAQRVSTAGKRQRQPYPSEEPDSSDSGSSPAKNSGKEGKHA